jgi:cytochrome c553
MMKTALPLMLALLGASFASQAQEIKGDPARGAKLNASCIGCHGIPGYQNEKYIVAALGAYKKGERKHPSMRGVAGSLSEQDMADLAAYYAGHGTAPLKTVSTVPAPPPEVAALLAKGACASCHGPNFDKPIDGSYPKIAGQFPDYLFAALKSYKLEGSAQVGRGNAIMGAQVKQFSNAELKAMAQYLASLPTDLRTVPQAKFR